MSIFKPYTTLAVGIALGLWVVPKLLGKAGVSLPGAG